MKKILLLVSAAFIFSGCASINYRANPQLQERIKPVKTITVMPMDVEVYKVTAGGVSELVDEFCREAKDNIKVALNKQIAEPGGYPLAFMSDIKEITEPQKKSFFKNAQAMFGALDASIAMFTYPFPGAPSFKDKIANFDYSFGSRLAEVASYAQGDALLFIKGGDYVSSGGRVALMVWAAVLGFTPTSAGPPHLSVALVDPKTGDVLWYNIFSVQGGYNFRNCQSLDNFMKVLLKGFPSAGR